MQTTTSVLPEQATLLKRAAIVAMFAITVFCVKVFQLLWIGSLTLETDVGAYFSGAQRLRDGLSLYPPDMDITMSREQYVYPGLYHVLTFRPTRVSARRREAP